MYIQCIDNNQLTDLFLNDPKLMYASLGDEELAMLHITDRYYTNDYTTYKGLYEGDELIGAIKWEHFTTKTITLHMYIKTKYQRTNKVLEAVNTIKEYFRTTSEYLKVLMMVPSSCKHVIKFLKRINIKQEGCITKCYTWRQNIVDLHIFGYDLREEN